MNKRAAIHFVLGPQGSGKTTYIRRQIDAKHPDRHKAVRTYALKRPPYTRYVEMTEVLCRWPFDENRHAKHILALEEHIVQILNLLSSEDFGRHEKGIEPEDIYIEIQTKNRALIDRAFALEYPGADCVFLDYNVRAIEYTVSSVF